jgi:hypothetical protein
MTEVAVEDLAAMTRHTGDEFGVVLNQHGQLEVIRGQGGSVPFNRSDVILAHTHPHGPNGNKVYQPYPHDIGYDVQGNHHPDSDMGLEQRRYGRGPEHREPKAIVYENGEVRHYDHKGPIWGDPPAGRNPVGPDGKFRGRPGTTPGPIG